MTLAITYGDPRDPGARHLLESSHALMQSLFPVEANHFLSLDALCRDEIKFLVAREGDKTLGCVALANKRDYGEVKSMFVDPDARGKSVGAKLLTRLEEEAQVLGLIVLNLETGDKLHAAHRLYERAGFTYCDAFGEYQAGPFSLFMTKRLG